MRRLIVYVIFWPSANLQDGVDGLLSTAHHNWAALHEHYHMMLRSSEIRRCGYHVGAGGRWLFCVQPPSAKIFMGDTKPMFIGGAMVGASMLMGLQLFMVLIGFTMIMSSVSVIMQRIYFKLTHGKRIFRMSPIHHHFELGGMNENQIVVMYGLVTFALSVLALIALLAARHG